ncbi:hypothetical protein BDR07DRAFT_433518 [Suillus spraguei]|nr:hypothetical protein BDR07DRAFT_433518 [Suillus spraguei]
MTLVSNDPSRWPSIDSDRISSYIIVASSAVVIYDWALTFGREIELVWRQRCSLMTFLYLGVRYIGILWAIVGILANVQTISGTDIVTIQDSADNSHCHFRGCLCSRRTDHCDNNKTNFRGGGPFLLQITWVIGNTVWEVIALCFAVWIAVKHFRELRQYSTGGIVGDCLAVLMKTHVFYFLSFAAVTCFQLSYLSHRIAPGPYSLKYIIYHAVAQNFLSVQLFVGRL